jgi:hypothetical protein
VWSPREVLPTQKTKELSMFKKLMALLVVVALLGVLPLLGGCKKNEVKVHRENTETTTETHTIVE